MRGKKEGEERQRAIVYSADFSEKIPVFSMSEIVSEVPRVSEFNYIYCHTICVLTIQQCDNCPADPGSPVSLGVEIIPMAAYRKKREPCAPAVHLPSAF